MSTPVLDSWRQENQMSVPTQMNEICRLFSLTMASANGIISFAGGDVSPLANEVVGRVFNYNFEEILKSTPIVNEEVTPVVVTPTSSTEETDKPETDEIKDS